MEAILTSFAGAAASALVGGLMGGKGDKAAPVAPPTVTPVAAMPDPLAQKQAQRRKAAKLYEGQLTSANTVLTSDTLG